MDGVQDVLHNLSTTFFKSVDTNCAAPEPGTMPI